MVENDISFDHLKPELVAKVREFTEKLEDVELKEVEVSGWREMRREIPIDRELAERWGSPILSTFSATTWASKSGRLTRTIWTTIGKTWKW